MDENTPAKAATGKSIGYTTPVMIHALLPYRDPKTTDRSIVAGANVAHLHSHAGLPYGRYSRLVMAFLTTEAFNRSKDAMLSDDQARSIPMGSSFNEFLENIGLPRRDGKFDGRTIKLVREQIRRIGMLSVVVERRWEEDKDRVTIANFVLVNEVDWSPNPDQTQFFQPRIVLDARFYQEIKENGVPFDLGIMRQIKQPAALDFYLWATSRVFHPDARARGVRLSWEELKAMFGADYADSVEGRKGFKKRFRQTVAQVAKAWTGFKYELDTKTGLYLPPQPPSVTPRKTEAPDVGTLKRKLDAAQGLPERVKAENSDLKDKLNSALDDKLAPETRAHLQKLKGAFDPLPPF